MSEYATSFGYNTNYSTSGLAAVAKTLEVLKTPGGIEFSNGDNRWRVRMETDNNLTFAFSSDKGLTYTVKHVFSPI